jgi:hypothetical protein
MTMQKPPARTPVVPASPASGPSGAVRRATAPAGTLTRVAGPTDTIRLNKRLAELRPVLAPRGRRLDRTRLGARSTARWRPWGCRVTPTGPRRDRQTGRAGPASHAVSPSCSTNPWALSRGQAEDGHEPAVTLINRAEPLARRPQRCAFSSTHPSCAAWRLPGGWTSTPSACSCSRRTGAWRAR